MSNQPDHRTAQANATPEVSVIIPARNEAASLGACLKSIVAQQAVDIEVIVVDDESTDSTASIARSFPEVRVIEAGALPEGWGGKNHAVSVGANASRAAWLLFTDADTVHLPDSLRRSLDEAKEYGSDLLSYSPEQEVHGFWERGLMPLVFAELTRAYRTEQVNDPNSRAAAANGQYLLIRRGVYDWVGGHAAIAGVLLEDVELARRVKHSGRRIRFRYGGDAVRTRMYRSFPQMWEGWTKNLAVLFPHPIRLAAFRAIEFLLLTAGVFALFVGMFAGRALFAIGVFLVLTVGTDFVQRVRWAHFGALNTILSPFGLPIFVVLLLRSAFQYRWKRQVSWKGRTYPTSTAAAHSGSPESSLAASK